MSSSEFGPDEPPQAPRDDAGDEGDQPAGVRIPRANVRWEHADAPPRLSRARLRLLRRRLEVSASTAEHAPEAAGEVEVPPSRLEAGTVRALAAVVGAEHVTTDAAERFAHAGGMSYADLLRRREAAAVAAPDAVVRPASHGEVLEVLRVCEREELAVVPYGGGTSVVGGVGVPTRPNVTVEFGRLAELVEVDETSQTATMQPGLTGPEAERLLAERGYTLGHFPQSWERSTVGGWVVTRSAGQLSTGMGRIDDLVVAMRVATPRGTLTVGHGPRSAAGPDLRELFLGSEGALGLLTEVTLRVRPVPSVRRYLGWSFRDLASGLAACRTLRQAGIAPDVLRLSDEEETEVTFQLAGRAGTAMRGYQRLRRQSGGCLLITGWEGTSEAIERSRQRHASALVKAAGGVPLGAKVGAAWHESRYDAPHLRDALLDVGVLAETLETATSWTALPELHEAVTSTVRRVLTDLGTPPIVMAHVSHAYPTGASLYVTVLAKRLDDDPVEQWWAAKRAAGDVIAEHGATITHHHAVGTDHLPWLTDEIGQLGVDILTAVKHTVDPAGILNPGVLVPPAED
ncbi:MAG: FAD-binding protein [Streptosporangiales bacterium]|nr:FAD-binding protein [Streptosporangiales bacterium]